MTDKFDRWNDLYRNGGRDPFYTDGCNLNIIRNQIIALKNRIAREYPAESMPDIFLRETPSEVDERYMARADEIRVNAKRALGIYKADEQYRYILTHASLFDKGKILN